MSDYLTEGWPLGPTSTVYMNGKSVYHVRHYGKPGIVATVELSQEQAEAIRQVVEERIRDEALQQVRSMPWFEELVTAEAQAYHGGGNCRFESEARAAELEAAAERFDTRTETLLKTMQNMVGHPDTAPDDVVRYGAYAAESQTTEYWLRNRAVDIRAGKA